MSANQGLIGADGKLWVMPAILEVFGFSSILKAFDTFDIGKRWYVWLSYAVLGAILTAGGILWAVFRKRIAERWPWSQRNKQAEPIESGFVKPLHNVQCTGFRVFNDEDFVIATLSFKNVPNGNLLGKFEMPRMKIIYYDLSTGAEITDISPTTWWNESGDTPAYIGTQEQYAVVASFFKGRQIWSALQLHENALNNSSELDSLVLSAQNIYIVASLSGFAGLHIAAVEGTLILGQDGTASFEQKAL